MSARIVAKAPGAIRSSELIQPITEGFASAPFRAAAKARLIAWYMPPSRDTVWLKVMPRQRIGSAPEASRFSQASRIASVPSVEPPSCT